MMMSYAVIDYDSYVSLFTCRCKTFEDISLSIAAN